MNLQEYMVYLSQQNTEEARNIRNSLMLSITKHSGDRQQAGLLRRATTGIAAALRSPAKAAQMVSLMKSAMELEGKVNEFHANEVTSPDQIAEGGKFDDCDLRHWLAIAEAAGVPYIPAEEILTLTEEEVGLLSGPVRMSETVQKSMSRQTEGLSDAIFDTGISEEKFEVYKAVVEKVEAASDLIGHGHVIRSAICGPNSMKTLAGTGTLNSAETSARHQNIEAGCGWTRRGNRTMIDVLDHRFTELQLSGMHEPTFRYFKRPWIDTSRRIAAEDPHTSSPDHKVMGSWPAEWRVFIKDGEVIGVGNYYAWATEESPVALKGALEAKAAAEKMLDHMKEKGILPVFMSAWAARMRPPSPHTTPNQALDRALFSDDGIHATLDFIETENGPVLLEGGPAHRPLGSAHPVAFSGCRMIEEVHGYCHIEGIALGLKDGVNIAEMMSWPTAPADHAYSFEEAERIVEAHFGNRKDMEP